MGQCCARPAESPPGRSAFDEQQVVRAAAFEPKKMPHQNIGFEDGTPAPPLPPPLVANSDAIYKLVDDDEDVCPTCLEEYTADNPRIRSECGHEFHLACIYEWLERSLYCPICAKRMRLIESSR